MQNKEKTAFRAVIQEALIKVNEILDEDKLLNQFLNKIQEENEVKSDVLSVTTLSNKTENKSSITIHPPKFPDKKPDGIHRVLIVGKIDRSNMNFPSAEKQKELNTKITQLDTDEVENPDVLWGDLHNFPYPFGTKRFDGIFLMEETYKKDENGYSQEFNRIMKSDSMYWTLKKSKEN